MNFIRILRYLLGYVNFTATGGFSERFINLLAVKRISVWNVGYDNDSISCSVRASEYKKLRPIAASSGMRTNVTEKVGFPFILNRYKNRVGLFYGFLFFVAFMTFMSNFIWTVDVVGNVNNNSEEIMNLVEEFGVRAGAWKGKLNEQEISRNAVDKKAGELLWMAINIRGSRAVIDVRDYIENPKSSTYEAPCNIVADFSGEILSLEVYNGEKANFEGSGVKSGDLLISGVVENKDLSSFYVEARGKISAIHQVKKEMTFQKTDMIKKYGETKERYYLYIFGLKIPLSVRFNSKSEFDEFEKASYLSYNKVKLPVGIIRKTYVSFETTESDECNKILYFADEFSKTVYESFKNTNIISYEQNISFKNSQVKISGDYKCIDFMGKKQKISLSNDEK